MKVNSKANISASASAGPHVEAGGCPKEAVEAHTGGGSWQDLWTHGQKSLGWSKFAGRTCDPVGNPHCSSLFLKDYSLEQFVKKGSLWEGLTLERFTENRLL